MRLLDRIAAVGKRRHLAVNTIECYGRWVAQFLRFGRDAHGGAWRHPAELGADEVGAFLTHLAVARERSASSQNQAANGLAFLYKQVLVDELGEDCLGRFAAERGARPVRVPTVLSVGEVARLCDAMRAEADRRDDGGEDEDAAGKGAAPEMKKARGSPATGLGGCSLSCRAGRGRHSPRRCSGVRTRQLSRVRRRAAACSGRA